MPKDLDNYVEFLPELNTVEMKESLREMVKNGSEQTSKQQDGDEKDSKNT